MVNLELRSRAGRNYLVVQHHQQEVLRHPAQGGLFVEPEEVALHVVDDLRSGCSSLAQCITHAHRNRRQERCSATGRVAELSDREVHTICAQIVQQTFGQRWRREEHCLLLAAFFAGELGIGRGEPVSRLEKVLALHELDECAHGWVMLKLHVHRQARARQPGERLLAPARQRAANNRVWPKLRAVHDSPKSADEAKEVGLGGRCHRHVVVVSARCVGLLL